MKQNEYTKINADTIDRWVEEGWEWGIPISHEEYVNAQKGAWDIVLTPVKPVPKEWFAPYYQKNRLDGVKILGLASGGGQQMPIMAALGATVTVLDYSDNQLQAEKLVAQREGYSITTVKADMTLPLPFEDESFDMIVHPISNCYVEDVYHVWNECYRILRSGGVLLSGMDNGINYLFGDEVDDETDGPPIIRHKVPYNPLKDEALYAHDKQSGDGIQFSHTLEEQIGGQLSAGFQLTDVYEDRDPVGKVAEYFPQYWASRSIKPD